GIAPPDVSLFLNVGHAHLSEFGSQEGVAEAKSEILAALPANGVAVVNADDARVMATAHVAPGRVVSFGQSPSATVRISALDLEEGHPVVTLTHDGDPVQIRPLVYGEHQGFNIAAAVAAAVALDLDFTAAAHSLEGARLDSRWRMEVDQTPDG